MHSAVIATALILWPVGVILFYVLFSFGLLSFKFQGTAQIQSCENAGNFCEEKL